MAQAREFYRSPLTPLSFVAFGILVAFVLSPWGPSPWRDTYSLRFIHTVIPWPVMSAVFLVYVALLLTRKLRWIIVADVLGMFAYGVGFVALLATSRPDRPGNPFAFAGCGLAVVFHYLAARLAFIEWSNQQRARR